jgi:hypothetical protein
MCAVQGKFSFYRKGTGTILPAKYAAAAEVFEMPFKKSGAERSGTDQIRNYLRQLRQARPRAVSAESRTLDFVQRVSSGEPGANAHSIVFMNCNACGSTNLIEGTIADNDGGTTAVFVPNDRPIYKKMLGLGGSKISSHACLHCGNLQLTVNFSEKDKAAYIEFEGQQPSLMERINDKDE